RTSGKAIHARVGDEIAGWKVTQIEPRRLMLASDDREVGFDLFGRMSGKGNIVNSPPTAILAAIARRSSPSGETWGGPMTLPTTQPRSSKHMPQEEMIAVAIEADGEARKPNPRSHNRRREPWQSHRHSI
ncbi:MAG TPA: hypothetical protein VIY51_29545, partial [Xanthobacteraceae bacterium]